MESEFNANEGLEIGMASNILTDTIPNIIEEGLHPEKVTDVSDDTDEDGDDKYEMDGNPCGKCIIFNNTFIKNAYLENEGRLLKNREGTDIDVQRLTMVFSWLKFKVILYNDREKDETIKILKDEASNPETFKLNCISVFILSHGKEGGFYTADGRFMKLQEILDIFEAHQSKLLIGKPKLFFIQACQGESDGKVVDFDSATPTEDEEGEIIPHKTKIENKLNVKADQFIFLSTTPGNKSWRSKATGTWFIQTLCKVFEKFADKKTFNELVLKINNEIAKLAEKIDTVKIATMMSCVGQMTLRKIIKFHPSVKFSAYKESIQASS